MIIRPRRATITEGIANGRVCWMVAWDDNTFDVPFRTEQQAREWYREMRRAERKAYTKWLRENVTEWDEYGQGYNDRGLVVCICGEARDDADWSDHVCTYDEPGVE